MVNNNVYRNTCGSIVSGHGIFAPVNVHAVSYCMPYVQSSAPIDSGEREREGEIMEVIRHRPYGFVVVTVGPGDITGVAPVAESFSQGKPPRLLRRPG